MCVLSSCHRVVVVQEVGWLAQRGRGGEEELAQRGEKGAASSPAASDPPQGSAPPAAGWSTAKSGRSESGWRWLVE